MMITTHTSSKRALTWLAYALGGAYSALFCFSAAMRLVYPYEVEWMEGSILDHAIRIVHGQPIYAAPSLHFVAWMYTPIYYYATALLMMLGGVGLWAGRAISIAATLGTALLIALIIRHETRTTRSNHLFTSISGAMLYLAFYHATGFYYDAVRMEALAVLFVTLSIYAAFYWKRSGYLAAAIFAAIAYLTKQQMIFVWPALTLYFFLRSWRRAVGFATITIAIIGASTVAFNTASHGWYYFYTFIVPRSKATADFSWRAALEFFPKQICGEFGLFTLVILLSLLIGTRAVRNKNIIGLALCAGFAMISASLSFGNSGGYNNVLIPFVATLSLLFPLCASIISDRVRRWPELAPTLMLLAFFALAYNPLGETMLFASARQRHAGDEFITQLRKMPGDVWIPFHGYIGSMAGKPTHAFFMAMNDALIPQDARSARFERAIDSSLAAHCFSAIILDQERVFGWDSIPHYQRTGTIFQVPNVFLSRIGSAPTRPQFIYRPTP